MLDYIPILKAVLAERCFTISMKISIVFLKKFCIRIVRYLDEICLMTVSQKELLLAWNTLIFQRQNLKFLIKPQKRNTENDRSIFWPLNDVVIKYIVIQLLRKCLEFKIWTIPGFYEYRCCQNQKQPFRGVLRKQFSENMQQIYRRTSMPKYDFNKVATLLKSHFGMGVLCCIFSKHFFLRAHLESCFCKCQYTDLEN